MKSLRKIASGATASLVSAIVLVACGGGGGGGSGGSGGGSGGGGGGGGTGAPLPLDAAQACTALAGQTEAGAKVTSAEVVAETTATPRFCKVTVAVDPSLNVEMRLPNSWNGKLHYGGGGGFNGVVQMVHDPVGGQDNDGLNLAALKQGYINISSDGGHKAKIPGAEAVDASWVPGNPTAETLYAGQAIPTVMTASIALIKMAYGASPSKSYFEGCSNGGREALISAQKYPELFDGIISRAPASNFVATVGAYQTNMKATVLNPALNFTPAKVQLLSNAALAACDSLDGVSDGIVSNSAACTFNAAMARTQLRCAGGADLSDACLSDAQLDVVDAWTNAKTFGGKYVTPGWALTGNESAADNWDSWLFGGNQFAFQYGAISGFILKDPATGPLPPQDSTAVNTLFFDFEAGANAAALASFSATADALNADLRAYSNLGRKLLLWHGSADPALSIKNTVNYYQSVVSTVGGQTAADAFTRFYVAPGVNHCHGGPGADKSDLLTALDNWVSKGMAPGTLSAAQITAAGVTKLARPLCAYPQYPLYTGPANDADAAKLPANFTCVSP